jgi:D-ribulokinase
MSGEVLFLGVDVGTGSARAGLFTATGQMVTTASHPIRLWRDGETVIEQSSADIWAAVCHAVTEAVRLAAIDPAFVRGIGVDATCSLVIVGAAGSPLTASLSGDAARDVIVWMDHRAQQQADWINEVGGLPLTYVGDCISPEMQLPKLSWLKENLPESFARAAAFMDLTDYLTWRATGSTTRSSCTLTCKWTYLPHLGGWNTEFLARIGLGDLAENSFARIGGHVVRPGTALGRGLSAEAAGDLGLVEGTPVAAGLIDAHAGGLGSVPDQSSESAAAYVFGTSACLMATTASEIRVRGVWGPYWSAMLPDAWLLEGGQTTAGAAIDFVLQRHPAWTSASDAARNEGLALLPWLERRVLARHPGGSTAAREAARMHSLLDFAGNRSPLADPSARGMLSGISLSSDSLSLERTYIAAILGTAYGARHILAALAVAGAPMSQIVISGGAAKSNLVCQLLADATGLPVARAKTPEPVLLGAAMLGAVAAGTKATLAKARQDMVFLEGVVRPDPAMAAFHAWKFRAYRTLQDTERKLWAEYEKL